ncbi:MAG: thioredoxin family protein, partial [Candidatus Cloacimonetes bacterium]|nr:thioredoxin family protein [Candidatus Cloacimonadota bacterium]
AVSLMLLLCVGLMAQAKPEVNFEFQKENGTGTLFMKVNIPEGYYQSYVVGDEMPMFYLEASGDGLTFEPTVYPNPDKVASGETIKYKHEVILTQKCTFNPAKNEGKIDITYGYQLCEAGAACEMPVDEETSMSFITGMSIEPGNSPAEIAVAESEAAPDNQAVLAAFARLNKKYTEKGRMTGFVNADKFTAFLTNHDSDMEQGTGTEAANNGLEGKSIWLILITILVGGLLMNLTPCVLPMIPITVAVIGAGSQGQSKGKGILLGTSYGLGMAMAYGILGLIAALTGSAFGQLNSSWIFNAVIGIIFILLALAMFDVFVIDLSRFQNPKNRAQQRGKVAGVFVMGIFAALLAGACVAPILIAVIIFAGNLYSQGNALGLVLPFLLGLGMALPWPFLGAGMSVLPKPGMWMKWVKIIFGVFILFMAYKYGANAYHILKPHEVTGTATQIEAAMDQKKPIFLDFTASWCSSCKEMDRTTFKDEGVISALKNYEFIKYYAEKPSESPTKEIMEMFGVKGLPTYIILEP